MTKPKFVYLELHTCRLLNGLDSEHIAYILDIEPNKVGHALKQNLFVKERRNGRTYWHYYNKSEGRTFYPDEIGGRPKADEPEYDADFDKLDRKNLSIMLSDQRQARKERKKNG